MASSVAVYPWKDQQILSLLKGRVLPTDWDADIYPLANFFFFEYLI
jgi:hypothetical protein